MTEKLKKLIDQAQGNEPADFVIKNSKIYDLTTGKLIEGDIAVCDGVIVGVQEQYIGRKEFNANGLIAVPSFIDSHLHIESSLVTPREFERCVMPKGTLTAICDPHEMANVCGVEAIRYFLECAEKMIIDLRVQLSSCVPATDFETSGAKLEAEDLEPFIKHPKVIGLAELMNFPGVLSKDNRLLQKAAMFQKGHIDGHCPLLRGKGLNGYIAVGIKTDHESTSFDEAQEKLSKGLHVLIREGSIAKDLKAIAPLLDISTSMFMSFCTDDRNPLEIDQEGHIDYMIRQAISYGVPPLAAYRAASVSTARAFGLREKGLIAPTYIADIVLIESLEKCDVKHVFRKGQLVSEIPPSDLLPQPVGLNSINIKTINPSDFDLKFTQSIPVIGIIPGKIISEKLNLELGSFSDNFKSDPEKDILKIATLERHGKNGNISVALCRGFGLKKGALASSVGHDSHNICVVGVDEESMATAVNRIFEIQGGYVAASGQKVEGELPLPIAGLISPLEHTDICKAIQQVRQAAKNLGCSLDDPFQQLAFLTLTVIPNLKISDMGLFDSDKFQFVNFTKRSS